MSAKQWLFSGLLSGTTLLGVACAAPSEIEPLPVDDARLEERAPVTSGAWTATATASRRLVGDHEGVEAFGTFGATFAGPAGSTRAMGACRLVQYTTVTHAPVACNTVADCSAAPSTLPTGGFRYCTNANNTGQKYCFYRPGAPSAHCLGTPATGGPIAPGSYAMSEISLAQGSAWISYACFEGCSVTDPSSSSSIAGGFGCSTCGGRCC
jgi:hypothetical protein